MPTPPKPLHPALHNAALERAVLNALINERWGADTLLQHLADDYFYEKAHLTIYHAVRDVYQQGAQVSMLSVNEHLRQQHGEAWNGQLMAYLADVSLSAEEPMDLDRQLRLLSDYAMRRALYPVALTLEALATTVTTPLHEGIAQVTDAIQHALGHNLDDQFVPIRQLLAEAQQHVSDNLSPSTRHVGILTGIRPLDEQGGLPLGGLTIVAAKPSHGKTSLAIYLALQAMEAGQRVAYYSTEMTGLEITQRFLSIRSGVKSNAIARLPLDAHQQQLVAQAAAGLREANTPQDLVFFDRQMSCDYARILQSIRTLHQQRGVQLFIIDYIQMLNFGADPMLSDKRAQQINAAAQHFKRLARDLGIAVILLSQLNRDFVGLPTVANIKEGGGINEASDLTLILYCAAAERGMDSYPAPYQGLPASGTLLVLQDKGRSLGTGHFLLGFDRELTRVYNLADVPPAPRSEAWRQQELEF